MEIIKKIVSLVSDKVPQINNDLVLKLRQNMINDIEKIIDVFIRNLFETQIEHMKYIDYREVDPKNLADHWLDEGNYVPVDVKDSSLKLIEYMFEIINPEDGRKEDFSLFYYIPFLWEEALEINGSKYYPVFNIFDRFILRIKSKGKSSVLPYEGILLPLLLGKLKFFVRERDRFIFSSVRGRKYSATILKMQGHHNLGYTKLPPALLYPLAKFGLEETMRMYNFNREDLAFVRAVDGNDETNSYFEVGENLFLRASREKMSFPYNKRFVATLIFLLRFSPTNNIDYLYDPDAAYFKLNLGKWIQGVDAPLSQQQNQALEHLKTCDRMIDMFSRTNLSYDGIIVDDLYELIHFMFYNAHKLIHYQQNDLFQKRISILQQFLLNFTTQINKKVFNLQRLRPTSFRKKEVSNTIGKDEKLLIKGIEQLPNIFMSLNDLSNDNWLLSGGARKYKSKALRSVSNKPTGKKRGKGNAVRLDPMIYAHASQLFVESILNLPSGNPCIGGTINIFFKSIDLKSGILIAPVNYPQYLNIYEELS